jgi:3-methyladenine DNA glycosylase AlkD
MTCDQILKKLRSLADPEVVAGMARFGINARNAYGISVPELRRIAKEAGENRLLAQELWASGFMRPAYWPA